MNDQDRITQLEASCAAMRELLITIRQQVFPGSDLPAKYTVWMHEALSTDAGKSLIERLQTAESALAPIKAELTEWQTAFAMFKGTPNELAAWAVRDAARLQAVESALNLSVGEYKKLSKSCGLIEDERDRYKAALGVLANFLQIPRGLRAAYNMQDYAREALQPAKEQ